MATREELIKELHDDIETWSFDQLESFLNFIRASSKTFRGRIVKERKGGNFLIGREDAER